MSASHTYTVQTRTALGSKASQRLRQSGVIPVTLSRPGKDSVHLQLDAKQAEHFAIHVVHLCHLDTAGAKLTALRAKVERDCLSDLVKHIDLIEVDEKSEIKVDVAIRPDARNCAGVKAGGIVEQRARKVKITCKAGAIPDALDIDLSEVQLTETVYAEKLIMPPGCKLAVAPRLPVLTIVIPRQMLTAAEQKPAEGGPAAAATGDAAKAADPKAAAADPKAAAGAKAPAAGAKAPAAGAKAPAGDAKKK